MGGTHLRPHSGVLGRQIEFLQYGGSILVTPRPQSGRGAFFFNGKKGNKEVTNNTRKKTRWIIAL